MLEKNQLKLPIKVDVDIQGNPKNGIQGNTLCWLGNFEFVIKDVEDDTAKLLTHYNNRDKKYKNRSVGTSAMRNALSDWCRIVGIEKEGINNMWARKTFVNTSLKDLQLPAEQVMMVTGHKSERQMREDYRSHRMARPLGGNRGERAHPGNPPDLPLPPRRTPPDPCHRGRDICGVGGSTQT